MAKRARGTRNFMLKVGVEKRETEEERDEKMV